MMDPGTGSKSISSYGRFAGRFAGPSSSHGGRMSGGVVLVVVALIMVLDSVPIVGVQII